MSLFLIFVLALAGTQGTVTAVDTGTMPATDPDTAKVVANVDSRAITIGDYLEAYQNRMTNVSADKYPPMKTHNDARNFLNDLVTIQAILISAEKESYDKKPEFLKSYRQFEENTLMQALMEQQTKDLVINDEEVKSFYENAQRVAHARYIMSSKLEDSQKIAALAREKGASFAKLAAKYSVDPTTKNIGGTIETPIKYWPMEPFESIFKLTIGQVSDPIRLPNDVGWGVFIVDSFEKVNDLPSYDDLKDPMSKQMKEIRTEQIRQSLADEAYKEAKVERNQDVMDIFYKGKPEEWETEENQAKNVSTVDGMPVTFKEWYGGAVFYHQDLNTMRKEQPDELKRQMEASLLTLEKGQALKSLCYKRKIQDLPDVAKKLQNFRDRELTFAYLDDKVESKIPKPTEEQMKAYYEKHNTEPEYQENEHLNTTVIRSKQKELVIEALARVQKGEEQQAVMDSINTRFGFDPKSIDKYGKPPAKEAVLQIYPMFFDVTNTETKTEFELLKAMKEGQWTDIVPKDDYFAAARLDKYFPQRIKTLEETKALVEQKVSDDIHMAPETDKLCLGILKQIRDSYPAKVNDGNLELARKKALTIPPPPPKKEGEILEGDIKEAGSAPPK